MDGRLLAERGLDLGRIEPRHLQRPQPLFDLQRAGECGLNGHLLVEREPDQKRERVGRDERVRLVAVGVVEPVRRGDRHPRILLQSASAILSAIAAVVRFVFALGMLGMIDASATTSPSYPSTRPDGSTTDPIAQVPTG